MPRFEPMRRPPEPVHHEVPLRTWREPTHAHTVLEVAYSVPIPQAAEPEPTTFDDPTVMMTPRMPTRYLHVQHRVTDEFLIRLPRVSGRRAMAAFVYIDWLWPYEATEYEARGFVEFIWDPDGDEIIIGRYEVDDEQIIEALANRRTRHSGSYRVSDVAVSWSTSPTFENAGSDPVRVWYDEATDTTPTADEDDDDSCCGYCGDEFIAPGDARLHHCVLMPA